jgi:oxygen-dependent protoporphyrinogen oxidase
VSAREVDVLVVGAGAAGLGAAHTLTRTGREVLVLEARERPGGVMQTGEVDGFRFERGPNTFRLSTPLLELVRRSGLEAALEPATPASRERFLLGARGLVRVPLGPLGLLATPLLSPRGKLRLLREPFVRRGDGAGESVAEFARRRLGAEAADQLVAPFLTGIYAGDEAQLGAAAVFPRLVGFEQRRGSIALGALAGLFARSPRTIAGSWSARGGLGRFAARLGGALGDALVCEAPVRELARDGTRWRAVLADEEIAARALVLAVNASAAARLLAPIESRAGELAASVRSVPLASVALALAPDSLRRRPRGFGFLVPRERGLALLGVLFMSQLFERRAPRGQELATALIGGVRWPDVVEASDAEIAERVLAGIDRALGVIAPPRILGISRWREAVAQPGIDHAARTHELRSVLKRGPQLALAGGWLDGVAVPEAFGSGIAAAESLARA